MNRSMVVLIQLLFVGAGAQADVIYSNLGPGDSFANILYLVTGQTSSLGFDMDIAGRFVVGPQAAVLSTAELALAHGSGNNAVAVEVWSDFRGRPGSMLASVAIANIPPTSPLVTVDFSSSSLMLDPGSAYWFAANADGDTYMAWSWNNTGDMGYATRQSDIWLSLSTPESPALRINGMIIPEPSPLILTGLVLMNLIPFRVRNR